MNVIQRIGSVAPTRSVVGVLLLATLVAVVLLLGDTPQRALAQPANDNFANATVGVAATQSQNNAGATLEVGEPQPCGSIGATAWWLFIPTIDRNYTLDTLGSAYNTVLAVYTGSSLTNLTNVACNDDYAGYGDKSRVDFLGRAGVTYYIQVGGNAGASGQLTLNLPSAVAKGGDPHPHELPRAADQHVGPVGGGRQL